MERGPLKEMHLTQVPASNSPTMDYPRKAMIAPMEHASPAAVPWIDNAANLFKLLFIDEEPVREPARKKGKFVDDAE
ncbi:hypothetical protein Aduo_017655 [Ancylostoma duodenale]